MCRNIGSKKSSRRSNRRSQDLTFSRYIFKVLKNVHPDSTISKNAMKVMSSFISDAFERIAAEGANLTSIGKEKTLTSRTVQSAVKLVIPG